MRLYHFPQHIKLDNIMDFCCSCFDHLLSLQVEAIFSFMSGLMCLLTSSFCYRNKHIRYVRTLMIAEGDYDYVILSCVLLIFAGLYNILVAVLKAKKFASINFNKFLMLVVMGIFFSFIIALILSNYKSQVIEGSNVAMKQKLNISVQHIILNTSLPTNHPTSLLIKAWDSVQSKLYCCGVDSYNDYSALSGIKRPEKIIPISCCSNYYKKSLPKSFKTPSIEHFQQCFLDARLQVLSSLFLFTEGCSGKVSRWLIRLINKMISLVYICMFLQACTIIYLTVNAYRKLLKK